MNVPYDPYLEVLPGESVRVFCRRYTSTTGRNPSNAMMLRCWDGRPTVECDFGYWPELHNWLADNVLLDDYTWYGHMFFFTHEDKAALCRLMFGLSNKKI